MSQEVTQKADPERWSPSRINLNERKEVSSRSHNEENFQEDLTIGGNEQVLSKQQFQRSAVHS